MNNTFYLPTHHHSVFRYIHSLDELQSFQSDLVRYNITLRVDQYETLLRLRRATHNILYLDRYI
jgi:hypothetical protein